MESKRLGKLLERRDALSAQIRREQAKATAQERKNDTRRKILAGAAVLDRGEKDDAAREVLLELLAGFLVRTDDRALFGLAPLPGSASAPNVAPVSKSDERTAA